MDLKAKNVMTIKSFLAEHYPAGEVADSDEFGFVNDAHSFQISGDGMKCTLSVSDKVLNSFDFAQIEKLFSDEALFDKISKHPYSHIEVKSTPTYIDFLAKDTR